MKQQNETISFEIIKQVGVLSENSQDWKKEINLISWNENEPKYNIRDWEPSHEHMVLVYKCRQEKSRSLY